MMGPEGVPGAMLAPLHVEFHLFHLFSLKLYCLKCNVLFLLKSDQKCKVNMKALQTSLPEVKFTASPIPFEARISGLSPISLKKE